ncbi:MAG: histidine kinase [bacterium]|nr:histidine kinase [bacterium]
MRQQLLLFILILVQSMALAQDPVYKVHEILYKIGDDPSWSSVQLDDSDWTRKPPIMEDGRILWYRYNIEILNAPEELRQYGVQLEAYGEYELFWDGVLIAKNGNPGQESELSPEGELWVTYSIPAHLSDSGNHVLALRASLLHFPDHTRIFEFDIGYYDDLLTKGLIENAYMHMFAGAFLIVSLYFLFLFISNRKAYSTLVFSICCLLVFGLVLTVFSREYLPMHYSLHVIRLQVISVLLLGISFLIPFYFSMQFPFPHQKWYLIVYGGILLVMVFIKPHAFGLKSIVAVSCTWVFSFGIVVYGAYKKVKGARLVIVTLLLSMAIFAGIGFVVSLYAGLGLILLGMLYLLSMRIRDQQLAYEESLVQSTRLQLELLKKNIQPHFLLNTLTSLIDWVEEAPKKGVLFIEALAREFELFNRIEDKMLIPIDQEIELCRSHLEIMAYRKEINYSWEDEGIENDQTIPPAVIHTLLENGITHSLPLADNSIKFKLIYESNDEFKSYTFLTFATIAKQSSVLEEGTGTKYIKARLTESYGDRWEFDSQPVEHGWKNTLKIHSEEK